MTVLLLSGTQEGRLLADALAAQAVPAIASLAGATRAPQDQALPTRIGGFGGADAFRDYMLETGIRAVLDATHPFAHRMSHRSATICAALGIPYCQVLRPAWGATSDDRWIHIAHEHDAAAHVAPKDIVFLATGRQTLDKFASLRARYIYCRQIDPPDRPFPLESGAYIVGRPPFSIEDEMALFQKLKIDWLVVKNAGGATSFSKLLAARAVGLRVLMIDRPDQPDAQRVETVEAAMSWVHAL